MIKNITVKVGNYDQETNSLLVCFGGELEGVHYETDYIAFTPSNYHPSDPDLAIRGIAQLGISILQQDIEKKKAALNTEYIEAIKNRAEQQFNFNVKEITPFNLRGELKAGDNLEVDV